MGKSKTSFKFNKFLINLISIMWIAYILGRFLGHIL